MERSTVFYFNDPGDHTSEVANAVKDHLSVLSVDTVVEVPSIPYKEFHSDVITEIQTLRRNIQSVLTLSFQHNFS